MEKLTKTANVLDVIAKILQIIAIVGIVVSLVACTMMCVGLIFDIDPQQLGEPEFSITIGNQTTIILSEDAAIDWDMVMKQTAALTAINAIGMVLAYVFFKTVRAILAPMKEGLPFHDSISRNIKKLGWISVAACVFDVVEQLITNISFSYIYSIPQFPSEHIVDVEHVTVLNTGYLLAAAVCFLLSYVFSYGAQLQQQSDETL